MARFDLTDEEWAVITPLLPRQGRGARRGDDRKVLNGIFYILRTGAPWRDLPDRYGPRTTVYNRYVRWGRKGVWKAMFDAFVDWQHEPLAIVADKAYGSHKIRRQIADEGAVAVIPAKSNARQPIPHDPNLYAMRNIVERFFCKMKDMRRLATRFEKHAANFHNMLYLFAIRCWVN